MSERLTDDEIRNIVLHLVMDVRTEGIEPQLEVLENEALARGRELAEARAEVTALKSCDYDGVKVITKLEAQLAEATQMVNDRTASLHAELMQNADLKDQLATLRELARDALGDVRAYREIGGRDGYPYWCSICRGSGIHTSDCLIAELAAELEKTDE
jgi:hypothetical protein